jgi:hypothetical protein
VVTQKLKTLVFAFPGTGKSYIGQNYSNAKDYDETVFYSKLFMDLIMKFGLRNGQNVLLNPFVKSYLFDELRKWRRIPYEVMIACPAEECKEEYAKRYKELAAGRLYRDYSPEIPETLDALKRFDSFPHRKIILGPGDYLDKALMHNGVTLIPKAQDNQEISRQ